MTAQEVIASIRNEIERRYHEHSTREYTDEAGVELDSLLSFLSDLEKSEKPINQEGLEEEIDRFEDWMETYNQSDYPTSFTIRDIARHFYDLGCRRTAEKYDEIEYNRQRAEESEKPIPGEELEKELDRYLHGEFQQTAGGNFNNYIQVARHFAKWGAEHLKQ